VLPCTTCLTGANLLRVLLPKGIAGNREECEVMIDQSWAIDNGRLVRTLKPLPRSILAEVTEKLLLGHASVQTTERYLGGKQCSRLRQWP
jgi:hypothetical protein